MSGTGAPQEAARVLYQCAGFRLLCAGDNFVVLDSEDFISYETDNPVEAWTHYSGRVDMAVRRRIASWCIAHGRSRASGEVVR